jgi:hypothetical protein
MCFDIWLKELDEWAETDIVANKFLQTRDLVLAKYLSAKYTTQTIKKLDYGKNGNYKSVIDGYGSFMTCYMECLGAHYFTIIKIDDRDYLVQPSGMSEIKVEEFVKDLFLIVFKRNMEVFKKYFTFELEEGCYCPTLEFTIRE